MPKGIAASTPLSIEERKRIQSLLKTGISLTKVAELLGRSKNCIVAEVRINGGRPNYNANDAQLNAFERRQIRNQGLRGKKHGLIDEAAEKVRYELIKALYHSGATLTEMSVQTGFGHAKISAILVDIIMRISVEKMIAMEKRILVLEGLNHVEVEEEISKDALYKKYFNKESK